MRGKKVEKQSKIKLLVQDIDGVYSLVSQEEFNLPTKIYGNLDNTVDRVLTTFKERNGNLGVLFSGIKGNSKTTVSKMICNKSDLPVIVITEPFTGSKFKEFLSSIKEETIIFLDEFEKVYNTTELQQEYLSILDGVFDGKKLFLFTSNDERINEFLRNRPSRIFYHFKYDNLTDDVINDIINKELKNKSFEADLRAVLLVLGNISVDVLLNFIDEVNRFNKNPKALIEGLNIEIELVDFDVVAVIKGKRFTTRCNFNPLTREEFHLDFKDEDGRWHWFTGNFKDYVMYTSGKTFIYESKDNKLYFTPFSKQKLNVWNN